MNEPALKTNAPTLDDLAAELEAAKANENAARERRIEVEQAILDHPDVAPELKDEGTVTVGPVKVTTRLTRKWDQRQLGIIRPEVDDAFFPFREELKEDRRAMRVFEERFPDLAKRLNEALTLTPSKPTVSIHRPKD